MLCHKNNALRIAERNENKIRTCWRRLEYDVIAESNGAILASIETGKVLRRHGSALCPGYGYPIGVSLL